MAYIDTERLSASLRDRAVLPSERKVLIARLTGSEQEQDLSVPANCGGYGRVRHFRLLRYDDWSPNPLPILPAAKALGYPSEEALRAQVFQNAACNWRCWYCYVDFNRLSANARYADYFTAEDLVDRYLCEPDPPRVIDLSGGQPDLTPEWVVWIMEALRDRGLAGQVFLWSDDNLSNRYFWEHLNTHQRAFIAAFPMYARVACFKGYDEASFAFNTRAEPELFGQQFDIYRDLLREGLDLYAYATFTSLPHADVPGAMAAFVDRLQAIHPNLPLRTVPLKIDVFTPTARRVMDEQRAALAFQQEVHATWRGELERRFTATELVMPICDVEMAL